MSRFVTNCSKETPTTKEKGSESQERVISQEQVVEGLEALWATEGGTSVTGGAATRFLRKCAGERWLSMRVQANILRSAYTSSLRPHRLVAEGFMHQ